MTKMIEISAKALNVGLNNLHMAKKAAARHIHVGDVTLIPVERGVFDVFGHPGWKGHARYRYYRGTWYHIDGVKYDLDGIHVSTQGRMIDAR